MIDVHGKDYNEAYIVSMKKFLYDECESYIIKRTARKRKFKRSFLGIPLSLEYTIEEFTSYKYFWFYSDNSLDEMWDILRKDGLDHIYKLENGEFKVKANVLIHFANDDKATKYFDSNEEMLEWYDNMKKKIDEINAKRED